MSKLWIHNDILLKMTEPVQLPTFNIKEQQLVWAPSLSRADGHSIGCRVPTVTLVQHHNHLHWCLRHNKVSQFTTTASAGRRQPNVITDFQWVSPECLNILKLLQFFSSLWIPVMTYHWNGEVLNSIKWRCAHEAKTTPNKPCIRLGLATL